MLASLFFCRHLVELHRVNQARAPVSAAAPGYYLLKTAWQTTALRNAILAVVVLLPVLVSGLLATDRCLIGLLWVAIGRTEQVGV